MASAAAPQTNGIPPSSNSQTVGASQSQQQATPAQSAQQQQAGAAFTNPPTSPTAGANAIRPRDARTLELLLTAQGVTAFEPRVPLTLLDFAYRHTSSILSDALHLSADPYTTHAGARPSATSGAAPMNVSDAAVSANAVQLAIASRLGYQFRGGGGAGTSGGGVSKEWMMELARERNKVALPRVLPSEWGVRLPSERFVLNGNSWGLKERWESGFEEDDEEEEEEAEAEGEGGAMEGIEKTVEEEDVGGEGPEGGTIEDLYGDEVMEDNLEAE